MTKRRRTALVLVAMAAIALAGVRQLGDDRPHPAAPERRRRPRRAPAAAADTATDATSSCNRRVPAA